MHPLVKLVETFIQDTHEYVKDEGKLAQTIFTFMIDNVYEHLEEELRDELGKAFIKFQFPDADERDLNKIWEIIMSTSSNYWKEKPLSEIILSMIELAGVGKIDSEKAVQRRRQRELDEKGKRELHSVLNYTVGTLSHSTGVLNALASAGIEYVGQLIGFTRGDLLKIPRFGRGSLNDIIDVLDVMNLSLGMDSRGWVVPKKEP